MTSKIGTLYDAFWNSRDIEPKPEKAYDILLQLSGGRRGKVLDAGCGKGFQLLKRYRTLYGDGSSLHAMDVISQEPEAGIDYIKQDISERFPFESEFFDLVFCSEVLEHLTDPGACLSEIKRVLKKGGTAVLSVPNSTGHFPFHRISWLPGAWLRLKLLPYENPHNTTQPVDTQLQYREIEDIMRRSGLKITGIIGWRCFRYMLSFPVIRNFYAPVSAFVDDFANRHGLQKFAYNIFIACKKDDNCSMR